MDWEEIGIDIFLIIMSLLVLAIPFGIVYMDMKYPELEIINTEQAIEQLTECEHDWVVTSKYNFWLKCYKTVSKCSKCGKVME